MLCACPQKGHGEDVQFYLQTADLPPRDAPAPAQAALWSRLLTIHPRAIAAHINATQFLSDFTARGLFTSMPATHPKVLSMWTAYRASPDFAALRPKMNDLWSIAQMQRIGDEAVASFFSGRWWELTVIGCAFFVNAFGASSLDPEASENAELKVVADAVQVISAMLGVVSEKPGFTLISPGGGEQMKGLAVFEPLLDFHE
ncbi:hypothetical protein HDU98_005091 [Podochytrium sp. JEL0797]|nr:hypothetical protein HDU98_005091 [Podochytrium sp. JEL0797]